MSALRLYTLSISAAVALAGAAASAASSDWQQFLGPTRNGVYAGSDLAEAWPKEGPRRVWQIETGQGHSGPAVLGGRVILFHRLEDKEIVECLESTTGKRMWRVDYPSSYRDDFGFDEGPRATPAIDDNRVYTFGAEGVLHCADLQTGKKLWSVDCKRDFAVQKGFFGIACSPLVEGNAILLNIGGRDGAGIVAFDKRDGKVLWKATDHKASYSSPITATINGQRYGFFLTLGALVALDPEQGKVLFQYPFTPPIRSSVTAATPVIVGDLVFISASYGAGAVLLKVKTNGPEKVWADDDALSNHYATSVHHGGFLFGIHGRTDPGFEPGASLKCVELATGKTRWQKDSFGAATILLAGDQLLILTERGELIRTPASTEGYKPNARAQILPGQVRAFPALAGGLLFARSKDKLACFDLRKASEN
jgi:outer membrane protein assembly factor BamB